MGRNFEQIDTKQSVEKARNSLSRPFCFVLRNKFKQCLHNLNTKVSKLGHMLILQIENNHLAPDNGSVKVLVLLAYLF